MCEMIYNKVVFFNFQMLKCEYKIWLEGHENVIIQ